jgi:hypothetical protein
VPLLSGPSRSGPPSRRHHARGRHCLGGPLSTAFPTPTITAQLKLNKPRDLLGAARSKSDLRGAIYLRVAPSGPSHGHPLIRGQLAAARLTTSPESSRGWIGWGKRLTGPRPRVFEPRLPAPPVYPQALHQICHSRDLRIGRAIAEKPGRGADSWQCSIIGTVILRGTSGARGTKTEVVATQFCRLGDRSAANFSPLAHHRCSAWSDSDSAPTVGKNFTQSRATTELAKYLFNCRAGASGARVFAGRPWCHRGGPSCPPTEAIGGRSVASHRSENRRSGLDRGCEGILSVDLKLNGIDPIRAALRVD